MEADGDGLAHCTSVLSGRVQVALECVSDHECKRKDAYDQRGSIGIG